MAGLKETHVPGYKPRRGKVRDIYDTGDRLVIVATDRLSAFDVVTQDPIPMKGIVLTKLTRLWLAILSEVAVPHHLIGTRLQDLPKPFRRPELEGRTMLCWKADKVIPFECVVRGYLAGSALKEYRQTGFVCGVRLPAGMQDSEKLPEPIFTPSTKAETGHDENVPFERMQDELGAKVANHPAQMELKPLQGRL